MEITCDIAGKPLQQFRNSAERATRHDPVPTPAATTPCALNTTSIIRSSRSHQPGNSNDTPTQAPYGVTPNTRAPRAVTESGPEPLGSGPPPMLEHGLSVVNDHRVAHVGPVVDELRGVNGHVHAAVGAAVAAPPEGGTPGGAVHRVGAGEVGDPRDASVSYLLPSAFSPRMVCTSYLR